MALADRLRRRLKDALGCRDDADALADAIDAGQASVETLGALSDVGNGTPTSGAIIVGNGTTWEKVAVSGDIAITSAGVTSIGSSKVTTTTINAQAVTLAKLARGTNGQLIIGQTSADPAYTTLTGDVTITQAGVTALNASLTNMMSLIPIEDLAADADITTRPVFAHPAGATLVSAALIAQGSFAGVDNSNTMVVLLKVGSNTIVSKTYNAGTVPTNSGVNDLGTLDATFKILTANSIVTLSITNGSTANPPAMLLRLLYRPTNV